VGSLVRVAVSKLVFPDPKSTLLALFILYFFRVLERRSGSLRFSSNLALGWTLGVSLELLLSPLLGLQLAPGPLPLLLPLFVPFFRHIPLVSSTNFGPVPISTKSLTYLLGLQLGLASPGALLSAGAGLLAGLAVHCSPLSAWRLPSVLGSLASLALGPLASGPPPPGPALLGATLEIQRTQQAEAIEQQLLRARHVPVGGRQMRLEEMRVRAGGQQAGPAPAQAARPAPSPVLVATLTDMGFPRDRVEEALRQTDNDVDQATNLLLLGM
jgi:hypothetical protein